MDWNPRYCMAAVALSVRGGRARVSMWSKQLKTQPIHTFACHAHLLRLAGTCWDLLGLSALIPGIVFDPIRVYSTVAFAC